MSEKTATPEELASINNFDSFARFVVQAILNPDPTGIEPRIERSGESTKSIEFKIFSGGGNRIICAMGSNGEPGCCVMI